VSLSERRGIGASSDPSLVRGRFRVLLGANISVSCAGIMGLGSGTLTETDPCCGAGVGVPRTMSKADGVCGGRGLGSAL
jgi:hypothetical protein